jgi:hypothetical protein
MRAAMRVTRDMKTTILAADPVVVAGTVLPSSRPT